MALTSLWQDRPSTPRPPIPTSATAYDVVVAGAGLTGLTTGLLLARSGLSVAVVEAWTAGSGTTGRSTSKVSLLQGTKLSRIRDKHPVETLRHYVEANLEGQQWLLELAAEHGVPVQVRPAYTYATTEEGESAARAELDACLAAGLPATWEDDPGLPFLTRGAVRLAEQAQLDPMDLVELLVDQLAAHGGVLLEHTRVRGVRGGRRGPLDVDLGAAHVQAGRVVLATGIPVLDRGGFFARLQPRRSYAAALTSSWSAPAMYLSSDAATRSIRSTPSPDGELLLVGGNGHVTGRHDPSPARRLAELVGWAHATFPVTEERYRWSAQDYGSRARAPVRRPAHARATSGSSSRRGTTSGASATPSPRRSSSASRCSANDPAGRTRTPLGAPASSEPCRRRWRSTARSPCASARAGCARSATGRQESLHEGQGEVHYDGVHPVATSKVDGRTRSVSAVCPHLRGVLAWNDAELSWDCPLHGSRFAPDGTLLEGPATCDLATR